MSTGTNKHGLSRHIPEPVARAVRQRCGFGCVVCGEAIVQYDHFDPEFASANKHHPDGIALLCPTDHARKANGLLPEDSYREAISHPHAIESGGATTAWEGSDVFAPEIILGNTSYVGGASILAIDGEVMLGFSEPEQPGGPPRLNLSFYDRADNLALHVHDNIIIADSGAFDIDQTGRRFKVRSALHQVDLVVALYPPDRIIIERMTWRRGNWGLDVSDRHTSLLSNGQQAIGVSGMNVRVTGPLLWDCRGDGSINSENVTIEFLAP